MSRVIYLGNAISKHGFTPTSVETTGLLLKKKINLEIYSDKKNFLFRFIEMCFRTIYSSNISYLLIDTYSTKAFYYAIVCSRIAKFRKVKYIPILHGGNLPHRFENYPRLSKKFLSESFKIITPSKYLNSTIKEKFKLQSVIIPNWIDIENYSFKSRNIEKIKLLWVRSYHEKYNPTLAIKVILKLHEIGYKNATLCMIGPIKDSSYINCKKLVDKFDLKKHIELKGKLSKTEWIEESKKYNIFINTTDFDNMPVSLIEIMALGIPIISTNVGGIPYMLENYKNAILVDPNNASLFTDKIVELKTNKSLKETIISNARSESEKFDWKNYIEKKYLEILEH